MFRARRVLRRRAVASTAAPDSAERAGAEENVADASPAPAPAQSSAEQIKELHELREQGILTEEEFVAEKKKLLES
jgi:hypothetical protein